MSFSINGVSPTAVNFNGSPIYTVICNGVTVWTATKCVTYYVDTGTVKQENINYGNSVLSPSTFTPSKSGYTFVGWREDNTATGSVLSSKTMGDSPITLYAVFKKTITRTFKSYNSTTTSSGTSYYNNGNTSKAAIKVPTGASYSGWTWRGWSGLNSTAANASVMSANGGTINTLDGGTVYGLYQQTITLSYNGNSATSGSVSNQTGTRYYNAAGNTQNPSFTLANNGFARSGYTFLKWAKGSGSGTQYSSGASVTLSGNTTFYAVWKANNLTVFTVNFNEDPTGRLLIEEAGTRNMNSTYLSSVMSPLEATADFGETNYATGTLLALTSAAKSEYKYITITYRVLRYCIYGDISATVAGETIYERSNVDASMETFTQKLPITNTNWNVSLMGNNKSSYYGLNNKLAVKNIVLSLS